METVADNGQLGPDWYNRQLVFYGMLLFGIVLALLAALDYFVGKLLVTAVYALTSAAILLGLVVQVAAGLSIWLRCYYCLCGMAVFLFLIIDSGPEPTRLFGPLILTPGFVALLGYRPGAVVLVLLGALVAGIFYLDMFPGARDYPVAMEHRFLAAYLGLTLFSLTLDYTNRSIQVRLVDNHQRIHEIAYRDHMTGLSNRRAIEELLQKRWDEYQRTGQGFSVLLCDIDHLKTFNDRFGHDFGDGIIMRVANTLNRGLRSQDTVARWDGDGFLILLPGQTQNTALKAAERLRKRVEAIDLAMKNEALTVSVSIGVVGVENALDHADLLRLTDGALYQAKHMGRNQVVLG